MGREASHETKPLARIAGEGAERSEAGEGLRGAERRENDLDYSSGVRWRGVIQIVTPLF